MTIQQIHAVVAAVWNQLDESTQSVWDDTESSERRAIWNDMILPQLEANYKAI